MAVATAKTPAKGQPDRKHNIEAMRQDYYDRIAKHDMTPLWTVMSSLIPDEPVTRCVPAVWHFDDVKSLVMELGGLISAEEAKRRVLILENPALRGEARVTNTLFAGIQMIMPGEIAPAHRHASSAIRFVLDGEGRLHGCRGREGFHVARRFPDHRQLGAARSRQHLGQADAVARRARRAGGQFLRNLVRGGFRLADADDHAARRRLAELLRLGRAA